MDAYLINPVTNERLNHLHIDESSSGPYAETWKYTDATSKAFRGCSFLLKDDFNTKTVRCWKVDCYGDGSTYLRLEEVENLEFLEGIKYMTDHPIVIELKKPVVKKSFWSNFF